MSMDTDRKRTIEARLDKLKKRLAQQDVDAQVRLMNVVKGTLDLLSDVLLAEDEPR